MKALVVGEGVSEEVASNFYYALKNWSTKTYGTVQAATMQAVTNLKTRLKEALMNSSLNTRDRNTVLRRCEASLGENPTVDRVSLWERVVDLLKRARTIGIAGALAFTLAACGGGSAEEPAGVPSAPTQTQSQTAEPSETEAPVETEATVDNETSFALDPASVEVPQDVVDAFGADAAKNLVPDALSVASLANEAQELHHAREGAEVNYWSVYREQVSPELWTRIQENATAYEAGDAEAGDRLNGLAPFVNRDGTLTTIDGVTYRAGERGIEVEVTNTPTVFLSENGRVAIDLPQEARAYTDDGHVLRFTMNKVLEMTPTSDGRWVLDTYAPRNVSAITVEAAQ